MKLSLRHRAHHGLLNASAADQSLVDHTGPEDWVNPTPRSRYNLVVLGGGTAGLVAAAGAAGLGAKVALIEKSLLGGDCLVSGCVPSKSLLRAARAVEDIRSAHGVGVHAGEPEVDFARIMERVRSHRAHLAPHDSAERFKSLGVDVFLGHGQFVASDAVDVGGQRLRFSRAVIATGGRPVLPPIPGLAEAEPLTNETVWTLTELPRRLLVLGGGPIGCELAQSFRRFGAEVTLIARDAQLLPREDPEAAAILRRQFEKEGLQLHLGAAVLRVEREGDTRRVFLRSPEGERILEGDALLVAAGRAPNVEGLGLEQAGVRTNPQGIDVDDNLRTSNRRIYAAGDVCSRFQFTHAADALARVVLQNALFFGRKKASALVIPWATYTDPEVAHVGRFAADLAEEDVQTLSVPLASVDRAILDDETEGFACVHVDRKGRILGATIVSRHAGEHVSKMSLLMTHGLGLGALAQTIHPYPTQSEALKKLGDAWNRTRLTPRVRALFSRFHALRR